MPTKNYAGLKFGKLTAISDTGKSNNQDNRIWLFRCECGNTVERSAFSAIQSAKAGNIPACNSCAKEHKRKLSSKDYTGQVFGKLTAISGTGKTTHHGQVWIFQCDCGTLVERAIKYITNSLYQGNIPMCARCRSRHGARRKDITGQRFGKLVALRPTDQVSVSRAVIWEFQCDCGTIIQTADYRHRKSCGQSSCCQSAPLPGDEGAFRDLYRDYRGHARKRGLVFELTLEQAYELFKKHCFYCGAEPSYIKEGREPFTYNGIDRLHNHLGYIEGNVVACCGLCNRAKSDMSYEQFTEWINRIVQHNS